MVRALLLVSLICVGYQPAQSALADNLSGYVSVSGVESSSDSTTRTSLRREINGSWFWNMSEYLNLTASASYFKTELDQSHYVGRFRKEFAPTVDLSYSHPKLTVRSRATHSLTEGTLVAEELVRNRLDFDLQTRFFKMPVLTANYSIGRVFDHNDSRNRDVRNSILGVGLSHTFGSWQGYYRFGHTNTENRVTMLNSTSNDHSLNLDWGRSFGVKRKVRLSGGYRFNYRSQTDRLPATEALLHIVSPAAGLYGSHLDALFGQLESMPDLTDDNDSSLTEPPIEIGTGSTNQQIGVDLMTPREVSGLYIYTDRLSDEGVTWSVYISEDGLTWTAHDPGPDYFFEAAVERYEISFETVTTRYVKAVSGGLNRFEHVFVTEIVPVVEVEAESELKQSSRFHQLTLGSNLQLSKRLSASLDFSLQSVPSVGLTDRRDTYNQSGTIRYKSTDNLTHTMRMQYGRSLTGAREQDVTDYLLSYNIQYKPLPTLRLVGSTGGRRSLMEGRKDTDNLNVNCKADGQILSDITLEASGNYSFDNRYTLNQKSDSWRTSFSFRGRASRALELQATYGHQTSDIRGLDRRINRDQYTVSVNTRPIAKIYVQGKIDWSRGFYRYLSRLVSVAWNISRTLSISSSYRTNKLRDGYQSGRFMINLSCRLTSGNSIYVGYNANDLSEAGGTDSESVSAGLRVRF